MLFLEERSFAEQSIIIEKRKLVKKIESQKYNLEIDKSILESQL